MPFLSPGIKNIDLKLNYNNLLTHNVCSKPQSYIHFFQKQINNFWVVKPSYFVSINCFWLKHCLFQNEVSKSKVYFLKYVRD